MARRHELLTIQKESLLPPEYQQVEYVENPDAAFIVTDFYSGEVSRADIDFYYVTARTWCNLLGASDFTNNPRGSIIALSNSSKTKLIIHNSNSPIGYTAVETDALTAGNRYIMSAVFKSEQQKLIINGNIIGINNVSWNESIPYMSLFGIYYGNLTNKPAERSLVRIYSCKFYGMDGSLLEDFIPCYRKSDNEIGMYGAKTRTFYTNSGAGSFLKGNNV